MASVWKKWVGIILSIIFVVNAGIDVRAVTKNINDCLTYVSENMSWDGQKMSIKGYFCNSSNEYDIFSLEDAQVAIYDSNQKFVVNIILSDEQISDIVVPAGGTSTFNIDVTFNFKPENYMFENGYYSILSASFYYEKCGGAQCKRCNGAQKTNSTLTLKEQYDYLMEQCPEMMIDCPLCDGSGYLNKKCNKCGGSGYTMIPGLMMTSICYDCLGEGKPKCNNCLNGRCNNPDYNKQYEAWNEARIELLHQMGYTDNDIAKMDSDIIIDSYPIISDSYPITPNGGTKCVRCNGTGRVKCTICNGSGYQQRSKDSIDLGYGSTKYTQNVKCGCDNGYYSCTLCGGDGMY